jgi:signal transduction histidine kinase
MLKEGVYGSLTDQTKCSQRAHPCQRAATPRPGQPAVGRRHKSNPKVELHYHPFDPARLLDETDVTTRYQAEKKGLTLITEIAPELPNPLTGDPQYIQQILSNLVSNAIKFTDEGTVGVRLYPDGENWIIEVADTGPGIPPEAQSHIFEPFWQVDSTTTRTKGGIGLGLSIVRQLTALMGGTVRLVSEIGQGSTFTISLPLTPQGENKA